jgi:hypothetical protein
LIDPSWFVGGGLPLFLVGLTCLIVSAAILLWLRGPGQEPHDPPIYTEGVRVAAYTAFTQAIAWFVGAATGLGGIMIGFGIAAIVAIALTIRARRRALKEIAKSPRDIRTR